MIDFVYFLGRFHVLAVHLPIGILLLAAVLEILVRFRKFRPIEPALPIIWLLGAVSALFTIILGYMHASEGGFDQTTIDFHRWSATATAVFAFGVWAWRVESPRTYVKGWPVAVVGISALLTATGHFGGNLTHGSTYLAEFAPAPIRAALGLPEELAPRPKVTDVAKADIYLDVVAPTFRARCVTCHNDDKQRGGLSLARYQRVLKGGDTGPVILPNDPSKSDLLRRVKLPAGNVDFMPKNGKTPLTASEIAAIEWWVSVGAPKKGTLTDLHAPAAVRTSISVVLGISDKTASPSEADSADGAPSPKG